MKSTMKPENFLLRFWEIIRNTPKIFLAKTTPLYVKIILVLGLAYCVSPLDFIPDTLPVLGLLDDLGLAALLVSWASTFAVADNQTGNTGSGQEGFAHGPASAEYYAELLGVRPDADFATIKKAYRQRVMEYHPDRVSGLGEDLQKLAERKMKELNEAFSYFERKFNQAGARV